VGGREEETLSRKTKGKTVVTVREGHGRNVHKPGHLKIQRGGREGLVGGGRGNHCICNTKKTRKKKTQKIVPLASALTTTLLAPYGKKSPHKGRKPEDTTTYEKKGARKWGRASIRMKKMSGQLLSG